MADSSKFDFCPKCGALARDGVCQSCGYQLPGVTSTITQPQNTNPQVPPNQGGTYTVQNPYTQGQIPITSQPQYNQGQGLFTGHPQPNQGQGIPIPQPQAPQGQRMPTGQPQYVQGQGMPTGQPQYTQGQGMPIGQPQYTQGPYPPQPVPYGTQGYGTYKQAIPPEIKKKGSKKTAIILSIVIGVVVIALIAIILFVMGNLLKSYSQKGNNASSSSSGLGSTKDKEYTEEDTDSDQPVEAEAAFIHYTSDTTSMNLDESGQDASIPYYSGPYNALKNDLSYQIAFTKESYYSKSYPNIGIDIEYPQIISGDISCKSDINNALYYEYSYYEDYLKQFVDEITTETDSFQCYSDAYVTYMDDKILSVVFKEQILMTVGSDSYSNISFYCLNFDLESGSLLDNTKLLSMDEAFALDFRQREVTENGDEALSIYSDQEIQEMLNDSEKIVAFYTPMGMEVGLNLDERVVYVTYQDYQNYLGNQ